MADRDAIKAGLAAVPIAHWTSPGDQRSARRSTADVHPYLLATPVLCGITACLFPEVSGPLAILGAGGSGLSGLLPLADAGQHLAARRRVRVGGFGDDVLHDVGTIIYSRRAGGFLAGSPDWRPFSQRGDSQLQPAQRRLRLSHALLARAAHVLGDGGPPVRGITHRRYVVRRLGPLEQFGSEIPGGCDTCGAYQTVRPVSAGVWVNTIHHDNECPTHARIEASR